MQHTGGKPPPPFDRMGLTVPGVKELAEEGVPIHVHNDDADTVRKNNSVAESMLRRHKDGDIIAVGAVSIKVIHTPG